MKKTLIRLLAIVVLAVVAFLIYQDNKVTQNLMDKMDELTIVDPTTLTGTIQSGGTTSGNNDSMTGINLSGDTITGSLVDMSGATESSVDAPLSGTSAE